MGLSRDGEAPPYVRLNASLDDRILSLEKKVGVLEERMKSLTQDGFQKDAGPVAPPPDPLEQHPMSRSQADYISDICKTLGMQLPDWDEWSARKASDWLQDHINEYKLRMQQKKKLAIA